jgi:hypothetical protein
LFGITNHPEASVGIPVVPTLSNVMIVESQVTVNSNAVIFSPVVEPTFTGMVTEAPGKTDTAGNATGTVCADSIPQHTTIITTSPKNLLRKRFSDVTIAVPPMIL